MRLTLSWVRLTICAVLFALPGLAISQGPPGSTSPSEAQHPSRAGEGSRAYLGQDLFIPKGQQVSNATCIFCSIQVEGDVSGRVLVLFGNLSVTGRVGQSVTIVGGNAVMDAQAHIGGRTVVLFGNAVYESQDVLSGSAFVLGGHASSFEARDAAHRQVSLSPIWLWLALLFIAAGVLLAFVGRRRQRAGLHG